MFIFAPRDGGAASGTVAGRAADCEATGGGGGAGDGAAACEAAGGAATSRPAGGCGTGSGGMGGGAAAVGCGLTAASISAAGGEASVEGGAATGGAESGGGMAAGCEAATAAARCSASSRLRFLFCEPLGYFRAADTPANNCAWRSRCAACAAASKGTGTQNKGVANIFSLCTCLK